MQGTGGSDPGAAAAACVCGACVCKIKLTPRKRPCFPYLMTTERVSPWSQAALYVCFVCLCRIHCLLGVWCNTQMLTVVSLPHIELWKLYIIVFFLCCSLCACICACHPVSVCLSSSCLALNQQWQVGHRQNSMARWATLWFAASLLQLNWTGDEGESEWAAEREIKRKREDEEEECSNRHTYYMNPPYHLLHHHTPFFTEWLCTVLGLLIPLGERIIFRDLVYRQRLLKSQVLHFLLPKVCWGCSSV